MKAKKTSVKLYTVANLLYILFGMVILVILMFNLMPKDDLPDVTLASDAANGTLVARFYCSYTPETPGLFIGSTMIVEGNVIFCNAYGVGVPEGIGLSISGIYTYVPEFLKEDPTYRGLAMSLENRSEFWIDSISHGYAFKELMLTIPEKEIRLKYFFYNDTSLEPITTEKEIVVAKVRTVTEAKNALALFHLELLIGLVILTFAPNFSPLKDWLRQT
jgi:hypothetical protein